MTLLKVWVRHRYSDDFSLSVDFETGAEVTALFGPSGSGKTTLLEMIAGFCQPRAGRIQLGEVVLLDTQDGIRLTPERRSIGFVAQDQLLWPHLSVLKNLRFGQRRAARADDANFKRVVDVLELTALLDRRPAQLSGGERQRVALGRAVLTSPRLLLLDESLAALDDPLKWRIMAYLERLLEEWRIPTLFVTHSQEEVRRLARSAVVLDAGSVVAEGPVNVALAQPVPLGWHDGTGPMNLLRVDRIVSDDNRSIAEASGRRILLPATSESLEDVRLISFSPRDVLLSRQDPTGLSARNHLGGVVQQIVELASGVFVEIDVGQRIWAEITADAARELSLSQGGEVFCLIKTQSLRLLR